MDLQLKNKTAIVCGSSAGIGYGCAQALANEGVRVWIVARDAQRLAKAADRIRASSGGQVETIPADLATPDATQRIADAMPSPDILVTNPGVTPAGALTTADVWGAGADAIVGRTLALAGRMLPSMRARKFGRIINITSAGSFEAGPAIGLSGALRATLTHASATLAREVGPDGVTINSIAPGPVYSDGLDDYFARRAGELGLTPDEVRQRRLAQIPANRFATIEEIGAICALLASPISASVTGRTVLIDGGANPFPFL
ncbi:MAG: SDR family oxidoreductase [Pseudomonadota bacterium]